MVSDVPAVTVAMFSSLKEEESGSDGSDHEEEEEKEETESNSSYMHLGKSFL